MSRIISANKLNRFWKNGIIPIKNNLNNKIKTKADLMANTVEGYVPDALAVKEGLKDINDSLSKKGTIRIITINIDEAIDLPSDDYGHITEIEFEPGNYIIVTNMIFDKNETGVRGYYFGSNPNPDYVTVQVPSSGSNVQTRVMFTHMLSFAYKTTYNFRPYQNSGGPLKIYHTSVKIAKL